MTNLFIYRLIMEVSKSMFRDEVRMESIRSWSGHEHYK